MNLACSKCEKRINKGDRYVQSVLTDKITCIECDGGFLKKGDQIQGVDVKMATKNQDYSWEEFFHDIQVIRGKIGKLITHIYRDQDGFYFNIRDGLTFVHDNIDLVLSSDRYNHHKEVESQKNNVVEKTDKLTEKNELRDRILRRVNEVYDITKEHSSRHFRKLLSKIRRDVIRISEYNGEDMNDNKRKMQDL